MGKKAMVVSADQHDTGCMMAAWRIKDAMKILDDVLVRIDPDFETTADIGTVRWRLEDAFENVVGLGGEGFADRYEERMKEPLR